jgi:membrane protein YqaA with SNARE-associated domain
MMNMLRGLYDWTMAKAAHPHALGWLCLISFIEASFFPIPPHPLLGLMCLAAPGKAIRYALACTAASVSGGLFGYLIGYGLYDVIGVQILTALGLIDEFPKAACLLREYDWEAIVIAGATPLPFKLLTITAGFIHMDLFTFLWASIAGRALIFMVVGVLFRVFGAPIKRVIDQYLGTVTTAFVLLVVGGFIAAGQLAGGEEGGAVEKCDSATMESLGLG